MRLLLPSLFSVGYIFLSLIFPLSMQLWAKAVLALLMLAVSLKYLIYETFGGSFFQPDLPLPFLVVSEALYAALITLLFLALLKDISGLCLWLLRRFGSSVHLPSTPAVRAAFLSAAAIFCGSWGAWQAVRVPEVRTIEITVPTLPAALEGFTLAQLSDIHIGCMLKRAWLEEVVAKTNASDPDAIVITGDFIDGLPGELMHDVEPLADLKAKHGVYAIAGNHEYYYGADGWLDVFRSFGVDVLHNEHRVLPGGLILGGVPDKTDKRFGGEGPDISKTFYGAPEGPRILLAHQPSSFRAASAEGVDLQLSGHTHGGLMFFLAPLVARFNDGYVNGLYSAGRSQLYVHPGTGLWSGFSCRVGVPSEIALIVLRSA